MKKAVLILLIIILFAGAAMAGIFKYRLYRFENLKDTGNLQKKIDQLSEEYLDKNNGVGLVVGIVQKDLFYIQGYGKVSMESNRKPDASSLFELASTSKLFTTSALQIFVSTWRSVTVKSLRESINIQILAWGS